MPSGIGSASFGGCTGLTRVTILLKEWVPADIEKLRKLGLTVIKKDQTHRTIEGTVDASKLRALAEVNAVLRITGPAQ